MGGFRRVALAGVEVASGMLVFLLTRPPPSTGIALAQTPSPPATQPPSPSPTPTAGPGRDLFLRDCAWCHGSQGQGTNHGPSLIGVVDARRLGPGTMPAFGPDAIADSQAAAIARYGQTLRSPEDRGGNGLGHLGPIPEGLVAWLVGLLAILLVVRWIGERA